MKLFHGSDTVVRGPLANLGRAKVDFGQGFYLTKLRGQAESWAKTIARRGRNRKAFLNVYEFDTAAARRDLGQRYKVFDAYDIPWLDYVVDCRAGGNLQNQYDVVEGGVANDTVIDTVEDYENGRITAEQALGQLAYKKVNHQICIRAQKVIDTFLRHVESVELKGA